MRQALRSRCVQSILNLEFVKRTALMWSSISVNFS